MQPDNPMPVENKLETEHRDHEPRCPDEIREAVFGYLNPEKVEMHRQTDPAECQATQERVDAAKLGPECREKAITNIMRLNRNLDANRKIGGGGPGHGPPRKEQGEERAQRTHEGDRTDAHHPSQCREGPGGHGK